MEILTGRVRNALHQNHQRDYLQCLQLIVQEGRKLHVKSHQREPSYFTQQKREAFAMQSH